MQQELAQTEGRLAQLKAEIEARHSHVTELLGMPRLATAAQAKDKQVDAIKAEMTADGAGRNHQFGLGLAPNSF